VDLWLGVVTFVAGGSGSGKSVACYQLLDRHVKSGGYGLVLPHEIVALAASIDQAISDALRQLHPALAPDQSILSFCAPDTPLLIVVEDINRSGQTQRLVERIARWAVSTDQKSAAGTRSWRLICPIWPQALTSLSADVYKKIEPMVLVPEPMSSEEGRAAVLARSSSIGHTLSEVSAAMVSTALGDDPLLIALHDMDSTPDPHHVIGRFIDSALARYQAAGKGLAAEMYNALLDLAAQMLFRLQLSPSWKDVTGYSLSADVLQAIRLLALGQDVIRLQGYTKDQILLFSHDRVRDWLLVEAAVQLDKGGGLSDKLIAEPFLAEIIGAAIARREAPSQLVTRALALSPLSLFHALRTVPRGTPQARQRIIDAIRLWLAEPGKRPRRYQHLYWECLSALARTDDPVVPDIVRLVPSNHPTGLLALLHNGDVAGGAMLCARFEPGANARFRDAQIAHARHQFGEAFIREIETKLRSDGPETLPLGGLLRLAGHTGESALGAALQACWQRDDGRGDRLADYLWAFARCCTKQSAEAYLAPVCDLWSQLPSQPENGMCSPKDDLAAHNVDWGFARTPPLHAIDYLLTRAEHDDLNWQITYMLRGVDHPKVFEFLANELARKKRESANGSFFFSRSVLTQWEDEFDGYHRKVSDESRQHLLTIWQDDTHDSFLREAAFDIWAMRAEQSDIETLKKADLGEAYRDRVLQQRLKRGDRTAIPDLIGKLSNHHEKFNWWWMHARNVMGSEIIHALDDAFCRRDQTSQRTWSHHNDQDWEWQKLLMQMPQSNAEHLLVKHWDHLRYSAQYVQMAFFICTPELVRMAGEAVSDSPEPSELFKFLEMNYEINTRGRPGITRQEQILALEPYLDLIDHHCLMTLSETCNANGWFELRKRLLDSRVKERRYAWSRNGAQEYFDSILQRNHMPWIEHEIDDALKTGVTWNEVRDDIASWYEQKPSIQALQFMALALAHIGSRRDLDLLKIHDGMSREIAEDIIADTVFSVCRRTI
jgi:hypothetical protein